MKKYIIPTTELQNFVYTQVICHSNDGEGAGAPPSTPGDKGGPLGAPMKWL